MPQRLLQLQLGLLLLLRLLLPMLLPVLPFYSSCLFFFFSFSSSTSNIQEDSGGHSVITDSPAGMYTNLPSLESQKRISPLTRFFTLNFLLIFSSPCLVFFLSCHAIPLKHDLLALQSRGAF